MHHAAGCRESTGAAVKERGILFSAPMVRALLDGSKTQTRRVVKHRWPQLWSEPWHATGKVLDSLTTQPGAWMEFRHRQQDEPGYTGSPASTLVPCPYGQPGDRLWVRETWGLHAYGDDTDWHKGPCTVLDLDDSVIAYRADWGPMQESCHWRPSIHMPRAASRITLEIVSVRVERLEDISATDALQEGLEACWDLPTRQNNPVCWATAVQLYRELWESINGTGSWDANPWVWVVEFKRIES